MKRVSRSGKHPEIVSVPEVIGIAVVAVQPPLVVVVIDFEHLQVAVRISTI